MRRFNESAAADMARDYLEFLRKNRRPDGLSQSYEWFDPDTGKSANPLYVATVALPYGCLLMSGLIKPDLAQSAQKEHKHGTRR